MRRLSSDGVVSVLATLPPPLYELRLVSAAARGGRNACAFDNGGCEELCLWAGGAAGRVCACADGRALRPDGTGCAEARAPTPPPCPADRFHCGRG